MKQYRLTVADGLQQPGCDTRPAPAPDGGSPGRSAELCACFRRKGEQRLELRGEVGSVSAREARQMSVFGGILGFQALRDFRQPRVASDERRRAGGSGLRGNHPESLREDRRDGRDVGKREQMDEMTVLERSGEERSRRRDRLQLLPVVAKADDQRARADAAQRLEQDVDALVVQKLAEVDDRWLV